jgi:hypothetical protein
VAKISGKHWKPLLDIRSLAIPVEERLNGEAMSEVMDARPGVVAGVAETNLAGQSPEYPMDILVQQSTTALGDKKVWAAARSEIGIAPFGVAEENRVGRGM